MIQALKRRLQMLERPHSRLGVSIAFITLKSDGTWDVKVSLCGSAPSSGKRIESQHPTLKAAQDAVTSLVAKYGGRRPVTIIDDITEHD